MFQQIIVQSKPGFSPKKRVKIFELNSFSIGIC